MCSCSEQNGPDSSIPRLSKPVLSPLQTPVSLVLSLRYVTPSTPWMPVHLREEYNRDNSRVRKFNRTHNTLHLSIYRPRSVCSCSKPNGPDSSIPRLSKPVLSPLQPPVLPVLSPRYITPSNPWIPVHLREGYNRVCSCSEPKGPDSSIPSLSIPVLLPLQPPVLPVLSLRYVIPSSPWIPVNLREEYNRGCSSSVLKGPDSSIPRLSKPVLSPL